MNEHRNQTGACVVPTVRYRDVTAAIEWLCTAFGFEQHRIVADKDGAVRFAQLTFGSGMVMLAPVQETPSGRLMVQPDAVGGVETQICYLFVEDAEAHYARARAAGADIVLDIEDEANGGRGYSCRDPEGHVWNFGTYDPWVSAVPRTPRRHSPTRERVAAAALSLFLLAGVGVVYEQLAPAVGPAQAETTMREAQEQAAKERAARVAAERASKEVREQLAQERRSREAADLGAKEMIGQLSLLRRNAEGADRVATEARQPDPQDHAVALAAAERAARQAREELVQVRQELAQVRGAQQAVDRAVATAREQLELARIATEASEQSAREAREQLAELRQTNHTAERTSRTARYRARRVRSARIQWRRALAELEALRSPYYLIK